MSGPCDLCGARCAPFGYAPPPRLGIKVKRPLWSCDDCKAAAQARVDALVARHDPFAGQQGGAGGADPPAKAPPGPRQGSLI